MKEPNQKGVMSAKPDGVLAVLARRILATYGINSSTMHILKNLIDRYVSNELNLTTDFKKSYAKSNLYNELTKNKMTMKVFIKLLSILRIKKFTITVGFVTLKDEYKEVSETFVTLNTDESEDDADTEV